MRGSKSEQIFAVLCVLFVESLECTTLCKAVLLHKKKLYSHIQETKLTNVNNCSISF